MSGINLDPAFKGKPDFPRARVHGNTALKVETALNQDHPSGQWPRLISLKKETRDRLALWLDHELEDFFNERAEMLEQWTKWQTLYWAEPEEKERNFPFKKAANIVVPLAAIAVEAIHARLMNTLFSVEPFYSIRPTSKEWIQAAKPFERYLQTEVENGETIRMFDFCQDSLLELIKLGTCVGKTGYERLTKKSLRRVGDKEEEYFITVRNGATAERVPVANFCFRLHETDPQTAPWVGERHRITWSQLKRYAQDGRMDRDVIEKDVKNHWHFINEPIEANDGTEVENEKASLADAEPGWTESFDFFEIWCSFDVDGDGIDEEIVVDYHRESRSFLSIRYNWYDGDLHRPYHICQYLKVEGIWPGIGVCKQVEQFQAEATTIHRQRLDNATLANMKMIAISNKSDYTNGEMVYPGKQWFLDDPSKDIKEIALSEIYPSSYANEEAVVRLWEKRSGANEAILGLPHEGTPATATSDLSRLAEGNKRFDLVLKNVKRWLSYIGVDIVTNMQIFGNQDVHWIVLGQEEGQYVEQVLRMPSVMIRRGAIVSVTVSDTITNREVEQRQWMTLFQIVSGYYDKVFQAATLIAQLNGDPTILMNVAQKSLIASDEALRRMLETFAIPDSDRFSLIEENAQNGAQAGDTAGAIAGGNGLPSAALGQLAGGNPTNNVQSRVGTLPTFAGVET